MSDDEEMVRVVADVPQSVKETAKQKLDHGGLSREIRDRLTEIAFGADLSQRSRLQRRREEVKTELDEAREQRREAEARIETLEDQLQTVDEKLSSITEQEDRYEAKLEELEAQLREDGMRLDPGHGGVQRAAATGGVEPEGVVKTLKERNPDVPDHAFVDGMKSGEEWTGVGLGREDTPVDERERRYR